MFASCLVLGFTFDNIHSVSSKAVAEALNCFCVGMTCLTTEERTYTDNGNSPVLGAYDYRMIDFQIDVPSGWHKEFLLSAVLRTSGAGNIRVGLNNIKTAWAGTWSSPSFRINVSSQRFKLTDIVLEPTYGYANNGVNLYIERTGIQSGGSAVCYGVFLSCFLVKD